MKRLTLKLYTNDAGIAGSGECPSYHDWTGHKVDSFVVKH